MGGDGLGVSIKRVLLAHSLFKKHNLKITDPSLTESYVWVISIPHHASFYVVCGRTLHEANINLRRRLRADKISTARRKPRFKNERRQQEDE